MYKFDGEKATEITRNVARFIVKDLRPYSIVESQHFKDMVYSLNPKYKAPGRQTFSEIIVPNMYKKAKEELTVLLGQAQQVSTFIVFFN